MYRSEGVSGHNPTLHEQKKGHKAKAEVDEVQCPCLVDELRSDDAQLGHGKSDCGTAEQHQDSHATPAQNAVEKT
tara:strand:+ start:77 stop:301 length:225 start_codon:yes stop_codon:yes gene_type:complete